MNIRRMRILLNDVKTLTSRMEAVEKKLGIEVVKEVEKPEKPPVETKKKPAAKKKRKPAKPFPKKQT